MFLRVCLLMINLLILLKTKYYADHSAQNSVLPSIQVKLTEQITSNKNRSLRDFEAECLFILKFFFDANRANYLSFSDSKKDDFSGAYEKEK